MKIIISIIFFISTIYYVEKDKKRLNKQLEEGDIKMLEMIEIAGKGWTFTVVLVVSWIVHQAILLAFVYLPLLYFFG